MIRHRCRTLHGFIREAWPILEPGTPFHDNWHIGFISEHLQAITFGELHPRLLVNVPPGLMKSLMCSVFWQAWEWGPGHKPWLRYLATAYNDIPIKRDSRKARNLIATEWFQTLWPETRLVRAGETSFENVKTGSREGVAFGSLTSQRGDRLIIDDPHSVLLAESDPELEKASMLFREGAFNRLNDQAKSAILVVMQRLKDTDISGTILANKLDYVHIELPMEFEVSRRCVTPLGKDPRKVEGEILDPVRFPPDVVKNMKEKQTTPYAWAGQYQQRPVPREGGLFKLSWFTDAIIDALPPGNFRWVRHWDLAGSKGKSSPHTAGVRMGYREKTATSPGLIVVADCDVIREEAPEVKEHIVRVAGIDGGLTEVSIPQDPGQAGKGQVRDYAMALAGFQFFAEPETGSKELRAAPFASQVKAGNVKLLRGPWNKPYIDELCNFPGGALKDRVDASSGAFKRLITKGGPMVFKTPIVNFTVPVPLGPHPVPSRYIRAFAVDFDDTHFCAVWMAADRATQTMYFYEEFTSPRTDLAIHAEQLRARGKWIPGLFEPEARDRTVEAGGELAGRLASNGVEIYGIKMDLTAGVARMSEQITRGRLKVYDNLVDWPIAYQNYQRDMEGRLPSTDDHLMRASIALVTYGMDVAISEVHSESNRAGYQPEEAGNATSSGTGY